MKYSVLMTVYKNDNPAYFHKSLMSMLTQTYMPDEVVLVKDGPITKELEAVIDNINIDFPNMLQVLSLEKNVGLGLALNEGIKVCRNELIARMDADDISMKNRCELQLNEFKKDPTLDIVGSAVDEFIGNERNILCKRSVPLTHEEICRFARQRDPFNHPTVMYRKKSIIAVGGYSDLRKNQDTDLWIKMIMNNAKTKNISSSLVLFRFDDKTYERRKNWMNTKLLISIRFRAYKKGFGSIFDLMKVCLTQIAIFLLPIDFQKWIYKSFLRE